MEEIKKEIENEIMIKESNKQILKVVLSTITGILGSSILSFVIGLLILKNTNSVLGFGFSQVIGPVVTVLLLPFVGGIVDKYDRKKIVILAQIFSMLSLLIYGIIIFVDSSNRLIYTYLLLICLKVTDQFFSTSYSASTINIVIEEHVQKVNSLQQAVMSFIGIFSPIIAVFLLSKLELIHFIIIEIFIEFITLIIMLSINFEFVPKKVLDEDKKDSVFVMFKSGLEYVKSKNTIVFFVTFAMVVNFIFTSISLTSPIIQVKELQFSDYLYGITSMSFSVGLLLSAIIMSLVKDIKYPLKTSVRGVYVLGVILLVLGILLSQNFGKMSYFYIFIVFWLIMSFSVNIINIPTGVWLTKSVPVDYQGRVFNLINALCQLLNPIGILIFSFLLDNFKSSAILTVNGILVLIFVFFFPKLLKVNLKEK